MVLLCKVLKTSHYHDTIVYLDDVPDRFGSFLVLGAVTETLDAVLVNLIRTHQGNVVRSECTHFTKEASVSQCRTVGYLPKYVGTLALP